jgi:uroporphyrin-III C-methyltransferase
MSAQMPVAIIERGFHADQRTTIGDLTDIVLAAGRAHVTSPAVVVVGEVVRLAHDGDASAAELMERAAGFAAVAP